MTKTAYVFIPEELIKGLPTHYRPDGNLPYMDKARCDELACEMTILEKLLHFVREVALPALREGLAAGKARITITWNACALRMPCSADIIADAQRAIARAELHIKGVLAILERAEPWQPKMLN